MVEKYKIRTDLAMEQKERCIRDMIGIATFFIVLIVAWLINYMVRFMLEKRSREFGIYLLIGMNKREVSGLYMKENLLLGVCSFVIGLGLGMLLQQVLLVVLYSVIQVELRPHLEFNGYCFLMTVCCFAAVSYTHLDVYKRQRWDREKVWDCLSDIRCSYWRSAREPMKL